MVKIVMAAAVSAAIAAAAMATQQPQQAVAVRVARFYAPSSGNTTIEGVCEIDLPALFAGARQDAAGYRFELRVTDSTGLQLVQRDWTRQVTPAAARSRGATTIESFGFAAAPGTYQVQFRVVPDGGGTAVERRVTVVAPARAPASSDLLLATAVRQPESETAAMEPGEIRRAGLIMRTAPEPRLSPAAATIAYYAEVYPWRGADSTGELQAEVASAAGRVIVRTPPRTVRFGPGGGVTRGSLDLAGLPEGEYRLRLMVRLGDSTVALEAPFAMAGLAALAATAPPAAADTFETANQQQLDSMYAPLVHLMEAGEQGVYENLSLEGKRRYLRQFWRRRDPTPGDAPNPAMTQFYRGVTFVNQAFREGGAAEIPGWRTDRGRIYLKHGRWDEILQRPAASPRGYEVWKYTRERGLYYVFYDQSGFGHFALIATNDRREPGRPDWENLVGRESTDDIMRFLGISTRDR